MQKLTRLLSSRLFKVEYELYSDNKYRLIEELPSAPSSNNNNNSINNRYSSHFGSGGRAMSGIVGSNRVKVRSRHLSMQGNPRHGGSPKKGTSSRPLSSCRSEGKLTDMKQQEKQTHIDHTTPTTAATTTTTEPIPEGSVSTILRNLSSASLSDIANTFKTDRKSTNLTSVPDEEMEEEGEQQQEHGKQNVKFGKKNVIPSTSYSNTPSSSIYSNNNNAAPSSTSIGKRNNTNSSSNSLNGNGTSGSAGGGDKNVGRRTISIQQLDTLWQDSGSKLLNFVHHDNNPQTNAPKIGSTKDDEKKAEWDRKSTASSIDEISTKVWDMSAYKKELCD